VPNLSNILPTFINNQSQNFIEMSEIKYDVEINAPVERVYEYYTNPDNIKEALPQDIVKESETLSSSSTNNEEGSEIKVKGQYMGKEEEMRLQVIDKEQNRRLVTQQIQGPFKKWESIQEFQGSDGRRTHVRHVIDYELPTTGKIANMLSGSQADNKIREGLQQAAQTVKQKLESNNV
jgi:ligand-binding SRPBCC domain-containing protein